MKEPNRSKLPSPQERLDLILLGLARGRPVETLCREAGVSRELFYRWMRRVRTGALQALEAQTPGPKRVRSVPQATQKIQRMAERLSRLEQQARELRKERDHLTLVNREALGIIRRRVWEEPAPSKKNAMRANRHDRSIVRNGSKRKSGAPPLNPSAPPWAFTVPRTGDGSEGWSSPDTSDAGGSKTL